MDNRISHIILEHEGRPLFNPKPSLVVSADELVDDTGWVKSAFLTDDSYLDNPLDVENRYWSSANVKFTDTRLGGNIGINSKPQWTRYADIRVEGRLAGRNKVALNHVTGNYGMGRAYSEMIDDPSQTIYMSFGVPKFNSLVNFLGMAFDSNLSSLARTGKGSSFFYKIAKGAGTLGVAAAFPMLAVTVFSAKLFTTYFIRPTSRYYTMKRTMHVYWSAVNTLVNALAVNRGVFPKIWSENSKQLQGKPFTFDDEYLNSLHTLMPDVFREGGWFDMYSMANRAQRIANHVLEAEEKRFDSGGEDSFIKYITNNNKVTIPEGATLSEAISRLEGVEYYTSADNQEERVDIDPRASSEIGQGLGADDPKVDSVIEGLKAEFRDGAQYAVFKVDFTGSTQESFSNSVTESDISQKINSVSSQVRQARFSFMEGNAFGDAIGSALSTVVDVASGLLDGVTLGISSAISGLAGAGYIDIPKHWQSSSASLNRTTYNITLVSPYGNAISQLMNIDIPLCMLLAGTLPLSTGKASYTSPFLCQIYDRGRSQIRLGMIETLTIERGTTNLGFNEMGNAMGVKVSFTVVDLSSIMHMPLSTGEFFEADMTMDDGSILVDYLSVLAGQDLYSQAYVLPKAKLKLAKTIAKMRKFTSRAYYSSLIHHTMTAGALSGILSPITFGIEMASQASSSVMGSAIRDFQN